MSKKNKSNQESTRKGESLSPAEESEDITSAEESESQEPSSSALAQDENKESSDEGVSDSHADVESAPKENQLPAPKQSGKKSGVLVPLLMLCLLVTIAAVIGLGYFSWQEIQKERQKISELDERLDKYSQQLVKANQAVISVEKKVQDQSQIFTASNQQSGELEARIDTQLQAYREQLLTLSTTSNDDWKLAEAYYLTRLAVQRLQMEKTTLGALALLQSADEIVKTQKGPALYRVREAFTNDITALQLAGVIDREGIYLQLSSIIKQLENIPSLIPENFQNIAEKPNPDSDPGSEVSGTVIENSFNKFAKHLQSYFRVQRADDKIDLPLSVQNNDLAKARLIMLLESAQLALLREESGIYQNSLAAAQEILRTYFAKGGPKQAGLETENLINLIDEIRAEKVLQTLPNIQSSQKILGEYLERLHKIKPAEAVQLEPESPAATDLQETVGQ